MFKNFKNFEKFITIFAIFIIFILIKETTFEFFYQQFKCNKEKNNIINIYFYKIKDYIPQVIKYLIYIIENYFFCPPLVYDLLEFLKEEEKLTSIYTYDMFLWFFYFNYFFFFIIIVLLIIMLKFKHNVLLIINLIFCIFYKPLYEYYFYKLAFEAFNNPILFDSYGAFKMTLNDILNITKWFLKNLTLLNIKIDFFIVEIEKFQKEINSTFLAAYNTFFNFFYSLLYIIVIKCVFKKNINVKFTLFFFYNNKFYIFHYVWALVLLYA